MSNDAEQPLPSTPAQFVAALYNHPVLQAIDWGALFKMVVTLLQMLAGLFPAPKLLLPLLMVLALCGSAYAGNPCPSCGPTCACTADDGCGDPSCPAAIGHWTISGGKKMPLGYRWNAREGYAFLPRRAAPIRIIYAQPYGFSGGYSCSS